MLRQSANTYAEFDRHRFREVAVDLTPTLSFRMLEVRCAPSGEHWSHVWPTSIALSRWLLAKPQAWLPTTAVEIGCGLGLVSVTLAHLGVAIEGTDRESDALLLTEENGARNSVRGLTTGHLDWSEPDGVGTSFLVAADVLYEPQAPALLLGLIHAGALLNPLGALVIAGPRRRHELLDEFLATLRRESYTHDHEDVTVEWDGRTDVIAIHSLRRCA